MITLGITLVVTSAIVPVDASAQPGTRPQVTGLSRHHGVYWGGFEVTVRGTNFVGVTAVKFGHNQTGDFEVVSPGRLRVRAPYNSIGRHDVRVLTATGHSPVSRRDRFTYRYPKMSTPIFGGLSAREEQRISRRVRAEHHGVHRAPASHRWTAAMGRTALRRAKSWIGLPYSWAGGNGTGPTNGVCEHNGGDLDCHVVGFDCSGLTLYSWWPYRHLAHYAATQHGQAGRFHPSIAQLVPGDLVFFSGYIAGGIGHVAVYAGHGNVIQAAESGTLVMKSRLVDVIAGSGVYRGATRPGSSGRQGRGPQVQSVTKQVSAKGGKITILGRHLRSATSVTIGRTIRYHFLKRTAHRVVVQAPAHHAGTATVAVSNPWGTVDRTFGYVGVPRLTALDPAHGPAAGGTTVTLVGRHLDTVDKITVSGVETAFTAVSARRLTFTTPKHADGTVHLRVYSPFGRSNRERYVYDAPASAHGKHAHHGRHALHGRHAHHVKRSEHAG